MKKISIITINLNNLLGLSKTVDSVKSQKEKNFEYIIVDGGSNDGSQLFINENSHFFDKIIIEDDKGIYDAMNKGISVASGEYLFFLNSGDYLLNSNSLKISLEKDVEIFQVKTSDNRIWGFDCDINLRNLLLYAIPHQATFYRKNVFERYDESYRIGADRKKNIQLYMNKCSFRIQTLCLTYYDTNGISSRNSYSNIKIEEALKMESELFGKELAMIISQWKRYQRIIRFLKKNKIFIISLKIYRKYSLFRYFFPKML